VFLCFCDWEAGETPSLRADNCTGLEIRSLGAQAKKCHVKAPYQVGVKALLARLRESEEVPRVNPGYKYIYTHRYIYIYIYTYIYT